MERLIVIGASARGVQALLRIVKDLPADLPAPVLVVQHVGSHQSELPRLLSRKGALPARHPHHGELVVPGNIYVAPPDQHMLIDGDVIALGHGAKQHHTRPAVDPLFLSAAFSRGPDVIGVVLTGFLDDGTFGLQAIKQRGGVAVVQNPKDADVPSMPQSAVDHVAVDHVVDLAALPALLDSLARAPAHPPAAQEPDLLSKELDLMLSRGRTLESLGALGTPTPYACPDCHGGLWQVTGSKPIRYLCHTGHGFSLRSLKHALATAAEEAVWNALRALRENSSLIEQTAVLQSARGETERSERLRHIAQSVERQAQVLGELLSAGVGDAAEEGDMDWDSDPLD